MLVPPTANEIRSRSNLEWGELGYGTGAESGEERLDSLIEEAVPEFEALTGLNLAIVQGDKSAEDYDRRTPLIKKAIRMLVEYAAGSSQMEVLDTVVDFDLISSMSPANYSETRRNIEANSEVVHSWPALNKLLLAIRYFDSDGRPSWGTPTVGYRGFEPYPGTSSMPDPRRGDQFPRVPTWMNGGLRR